MVFFAISWCKLQLQSWEKTFHCWFKPCNKVIGGEKEFEIAFNLKLIFRPYLNLSPSCSFRAEKKHSIGKIKFCIGLSLVIKLLVGKRAWNSCFQLKTDFWPYLSPSWSCKAEKKHSIGKIKFCIGLSLIIKLLVGKRAWNSCFQPKTDFWPYV